MKLKQIKREAANVDRALREMKSDLTSVILSLPTNPRSEKLADNVFAVQFSELKDSWSAEYHDFEYQYGLIISMIEDCLSIMQIAHFLERLTGDSVKLVKYKGQQIKFHPRVIENLRKALK